MSEITTTTTEESTETRDAEAALNYIADGWISEPTAKELANSAIERRQVLAAEIIALAETGLDEGELNRAQWMAGILCREELTQTAKTVFVETTSLKTYSGRKAGLGDRAFTSGRHSSGYTSGW